MLQTLRDVHVPYQHTCFSLLDWKVCWKHDIVEQEYRIILIVEEDQNLRRNEIL